MLSGGVESSALLAHGLDNDYELEAIHSTWNKKSAYEGKKARQIAEYYGVPYSEIIIDATNFNISNGRLGTQYKAADSPYWGAALLVTAEISGCDEIWFGSYLGETPPGAGGPAGVNLILQSVGVEARVKSPLYLKTKQQQWEMLKDDVKKLVISCAKQYKDDKDCFERTDREMCQKCKEWKKWNIVRDV